MVNSLVFRWPKPSFFMVLGAHERSGRSRSVVVFISIYIYVDMNFLLGTCLVEKMQWGFVEFSRSLSIVKLFFLPPKLQ